MTAVVSDAPPAALRRTPRQQRSRDRVGAILDAAASVIDREGPEGLTTTAVADAAGMPVGTLYQYFANATALVDALVQRHDNRLRSVLEGTLERGGYRDPDEVGPALVAAYVTYLRTEPGFRALWFSPRFDASARAMDEPSANALVAATVNWLRASGLVAAGDEEDLEVSVLVRWRVAEALIDLAFRLDPDGDERVLDRLRRLLTPPGLSL